jgi:hypothetical protein
MALSTVLFGCPNQELAPLTPCTVSGVSLEVPQSGVDKVDMLFMIDNSGSMSQEQKKLALVLPKLVAILATGNKDGLPKPAGVKPDFPPVQSLHIGVVTSDMGINGAPAQNSCGNLSFIATERDTRAATMRINKPVGDDGILQVDTSVAATGIWAPPEGGGDVAEVVPADPACANITFPPTARYVDFNATMGNAADAALRFSCIAKRGRNGCGLEQQLESVLKALTPPDSAIKFTAQSPNGHGNAIKAGAPSGYNQTFLREDSILAVVVVSDEEDCSIPDKSAAIFNAMDTSINGGINVRCGLKENQGLLHPVSRFIDGITALKPPAYKDRLIFTAIAGIPLAPNTGDKVHIGAAALDKLLARPDMQFGVRPNASGTDQEPVPTCTSESGDGSAAPGRRYLEVAKAFDQNGLVTSICEDEYGTLLNSLIDKIAAQLTGACLPRKLTPNPETGKVSCDVVEIQAAGSQLGCDPAKGRIEQLPPRRVNGTDRTVCRIDQITPGQNKEGWYYDDNSKTVMEQCKKDPQRIAFTDNGNPPQGAQAKFECFQPVQTNATDQDRGRDAVNLNCAPNPTNATAPAGDGLCNARGDAVAPLICIQDTCQIACDGDSQCPPGWLCTADLESKRLYCVNPTCPASVQ